tara:strand:- start:9 stop:290 length:282 start_codon:yes stop_codon:yes gene_type:complete
MPKSIIEKVVAEGGRGTFRQRVERSLEEAPSSLSPSGDTEVQSGIEELGSAAESLWLKLPQTDRNRDLLQEIWTRVQRIGQSHGLGLTSDIFR